MRQFERIDQVLSENDITGMGLNLTPTLIYSNIRKAMEQYGNDQYIQGRKDTNKKYELILKDTGGIASENIRLRQLVKAQKELMGLHIKLLDTEFLSNSEWDKLQLLLNTIKELEK